MLCMRSFGSNYYIVLKQIVCMCVGLFAHCQRAAIRILNAACIEHICICIKDKSWIGDSYKYVSKVSELKVKVVV